MGLSDRIKALKGNSVANTAKSLKSYVRGGGKIPEIAQKAKQYESLIGKFLKGDLDEKRQILTSLSSERKDDQEYMSQQDTFLSEFVDDDRVLMTDIMELELFGAHFALRATFHCFGNKRNSVQKATNRLFYVTPIFSEKNPLSDGVVVPLDRGFKNGERHVKYLYEPEAMSAVEAFGALAQFGPYGNLANADWVKELTKEEFLQGSEVVIPPKPKEEKEEIDASKIADIIQLLQASGIKVVLPEAPSKEETPSKVEPGFSSPSVEETEEEATARKRSESAKKGAETRALNKAKAEAEAEAEEADSQE